MSDLTASRLSPPELPRLDQWIVWAALASLLLHAGILAFLLWQPLPDAAEAEQPAAVDVELVPPPEAAGGSAPPVEEPAEQPAAAEPPPADEPSEAAPAEPETAPPAETTPADSSPTETATAPAETTVAETPPEQAAAPASSTAEASSPEAPETAAAPAEPEAAETAASEPPPQGAVDTAKVAPIPLARPKVSGLTAQASEEGDAAPAADTVESPEGAVAAATEAEPDVATLQLGEPRSAEQFFLEAMLDGARMGSVREALKTLPAERRLAQTCNIEALAQIGYSGEGFAPDVVMAEAYTLAETTSTRFVANGAIFRSGEKWYGVAFDCTLSDDLTEVTAFTYRLGADVTEAVLARLNKN